VLPSHQRNLRRWKPSAYRGVLKGCLLYEYRCKGLMRVIARFVDANPERGIEETFLLLTVTLSHDHERMKRLIKQNRSGITHWPSETQGA